MGLANVTSANSAGIVMLSRMNVADRKCVAWLLSVSEKKRKLDNVRNVLKLNVNDSKSKTASGRCANNRRNANGLNARRPRHNAVRLKHNSAAPLRLRQNASAFRSSEHDKRQTLPNNVLSFSRSGSVASRHNSLLPRHLHRHRRRLHLRHRETGMKAQNNSA